MLAAVVLRQRTPMIRTACPGEADRTRLSGARLESSGVPRSTENRRETRMESSRSTAGAPDSSAHLEGLFFCEMIVAILPIIPSTVLGQLQVQVVNVLLKGQYMI